MNNSIKNKEEFDQFWNLQFRPLWDAHKDGMKSNTKTAEKYLEDILKLIISLSTGLLAFMVAIKEGLLQSLIPDEMRLLLFGFLLSILFAVLDLSWSKRSKNDKK